jgi:hypothetical protein
MRNSSVFSRACRAEDIGEAMALYRAVVNHMNNMGNYQWAEHYPTEELLAYFFF